MNVFVLLLIQTSLASQQNTQTCAIIGKVIFNSLPTSSCIKVRAFHIFFNFVFRKGCFSIWGMFILALGSANKRGRPAHVCSEAGPCAAILKAKPQCWSLEDGPLCLWWEFLWRARSQNINTPHPVPCSTETFGQTQCPEGLFPLHLTRWDQLWP